MEEMHLYKILVAKQKCHTNTVCALLELTAIYKSQYRKCQSTSI